MTLNAPMDSSSTKPPYLDGGGDESETLRLAETAVADELFEGFAEAEDGFEDAEVGSAADAVGRD